MFPSTNLSATDIQTICFSRSVTPYLHPPGRNSVDIGIWLQLPREEQSRRHNRRLGLPLQIPPHLPGRDRGPHGRSGALVRLLFIPAEAGHLGEAALQTEVVDPGVAT